MLFGKKIRELRNEQGLLQRQLSAALEIDTPMLSGETGACWDSMGVIKQCQDLHFRAGRQD